MTSRTLAIRIRVVRTFLIFVHSLRSSFIHYNLLFTYGAATQRRPWLPRSKRFLYHTRHNTVGSAPLDKWSARRRDPYLTAYNTHNRQTSTPMAGIDPTISAGEQPQTYALGYATLEPDTTQHDCQDILQIRKQISKTLLFMSAATLKPIRLECYLHRMAGVSV